MGEYDFVFEYSFGLLFIHLFLGSGVELGIVFISFLKDQKSRNSMNRDSSICNINASL